LRICCRYTTNIKRHRATSTMQSTAACLSSHLHGRSRG
jgi:hypothetical protein